MLASRFWAERRPTSGAGSSTVVLSDTVDLVNPATGLAEIALELFVEGSGTVTVAVVCPDGNTDTYTVPANSRIPIACKRVKLTGTTGGLVVHAIW